MCGAHTVRVGASKMADSSALAASPSRRDAHLVTSAALKLVAKMQIQEHVDVLTSTRLLPDKYEHFELQFIDTNWGLMVHLGAPCTP